MLASRKRSSLWTFAAAVYALVLSALPTLAFTTEQAAREIERIFQHKKLSGARICALVTDCMSGEVFYSRNPSAALIPASNEKLPVTAAALLLLGPAYRFPTAVYAAGPIGEDGIVDGPLMVVGSADPTAGLDIYASMAEELRKRGVKGCKGILVSGAVTARKSDGPSASPEFLRCALQEVGIHVLPGTVPVATVAQARPLIQHLSPTLGEVILTINKRSLNSWADNLWRAMGWLLAGGPENMPQFLYAFWGQRGLDLSGVVMVDGSGLSRAIRATPAFLVGLLRYMYRCAEWPAFAGSLPIAGQEGTLSKRMRNSIAAGRVWAKTGTLHRVCTLSGYATTLSGRLLAFSLLLNNLSCSRESARYLVDKVCEVIVQIEAEETTARHSQSATGEGG